MCVGCRHPRLMVNVNQGFPTKPSGSTGLTRQRSTEPEIFTFDIPPEVKHTPDTSPRLRARRRPVKILYPAQVRKYMPPEEKDWAKRMLLLLLCVVAAQVYAAVAEAQGGTVDAIAQAGGPGGSPPNLSGERALGLPPPGGETLRPANGSAPRLPKAPDGASLAVTYVPQSGLQICCLQNVKQPSSWLDTLHTASSHPRPLVQWKFGHSNWYVQ
ncbi:radiation-inducible immediate-early gene IEX-1-like [Stegostoma tigrinum]|uniref:radiation-inducible immediate-early gene IEX-1-like n=1 Tax=Stegostoma tigrinum TaxID=3053191 RepID=UPI002870B12F|nr:radiation-inducible immediate-early gene IEX-1-like [Stegostoma tigrinum]